MFAFLTPNNQKERRTLLIKENPRHLLVLISATDIFTMHFGTMEIKPYMQILNSTIWEKTNLKNLILAQMFLLMWDQDNLSALLEELKEVFLPEELVCHLNENR
jgi:hypothetical protein